MCAIRDNGAQIPEGEDVAAAFTVVRHRSADEHGQKQNAELGPGEAKGELGASDDRPHAVAGLDTAPRRFSSSSFAIAMWLFRMNNRCE
jgi:hypothetical protein